MRDTNRGEPHGTWHGRWTAVAMSAPRCGISMSTRPILRTNGSLTRFLVARCDSHHAGWRAVRQVIVDSAADAPWEKCARRAVPMVAGDLIALAGTAGRTQLPQAQHIAAQRRAEQIASHVDQPAVLTGLGLRCAVTTPDRWRLALSSAVRARSREQVARAVDRSLQGD
jgi:hypothetical protein